MPLTLATVGSKGASPAPIWHPRPSSCPFTPPRRCLAQSSFVCLFLFLPSRLAALPPWRPSRLPRSTRTLLLYLSLERGGQAPLLSHCSLRGPPGCALVMGIGTGSPPRWPWHLLGTCHAAATGTSWDGTGGPFPSGTARLHRLLSLLQGRAVSLGVRPGGDPPKSHIMSPVGEEGRPLWGCSLVQNQQWPPNLSQRDVLSTMQPLSLAPERGTCPTQPFPALFPLPATLAKPGVLWLSIGAKTPSPCRARPLSPCAQ